MSLLTDREIEQLAEGIAIDDFNHDLARRVEAAVLRKLATVNVEPCAVRHSFDGYGYLYGDSGSGSLWKERAMAEPNAEVTG